MDAENSPTKSSAVFYNGFKYVRLKFKVRAIPCGAI